MICTVSNIYLLCKTEILYCQADNTYSVVCMVGRRITVSKTLGQLEKDISSEYYLRVSQSYLVNLLKINYIDKKSKRIVLQNGDFVPYRIKVAEIIQRLDRIYA